MELEVLILAPDHNTVVTQVTAEQKLWLQARSLRKFVLPRHFSNDYTMIYANACLVLDLEWASRSMPSSW
jgi:hypothetical protein